VHERGPVDWARQLAALIADDAFAALAGRQTGLGVDFVDEAVELARDGAEALVGGRQRRLAQLARGDVDHEAEHALVAPSGARSTT
jgi:hypothetical protein